MIDKTEAGWPAGIAATGLAPGATAAVYSDAQPSGGMTEPGSAGTSPKRETVKELAVRADAGVAVLQGRVDTLKGKPVAVITSDPKELSGIPRVPICAICGY